MTASGTFGYGLEYADLVDLGQLGGIIVKGTTLQPREGNPYPRMVETPHGMLNCVGLQNKGVDYFCEHIYPQVQSLPTQVIVNVSGNSPEDYAECARRINELEHIPAIELNISCPNVKHGGMAFGTSPEGAASVVKAVRAVYDSRGRGCRCRESDKHPDGNGHRCREAQACAQHRHGRTERSVCETCGPAHGMAGGPCSTYTRDRSGWNQQCCGCRGVSPGRSFSSGDRNRQLR